MANNSRWISFTTVRNEHWVHDNVVILGDAAHTAHFSIGSGTKLAMEDALALAACLHEEPDLGAALTTYEVERKAVVLSTQRAAQASLEWFENLHQYVDQEPLQFAFNAMTRSRRVTYDNLRVRDPEFVARCEEWFARRVKADGHGAGDVRPPMFQPFRLSTRDGTGLELVNRVVVSPMDQYVAVDGHPGDFHLVHLGGKALGGAGLVMTEMVCVSPTGRISPGCTGLWNDEQQAAWRRVTDFVHTHSSARIGLQLGHSGPKGSTKLMWEGIDEPLPADNWEVVAPSPVAYRDGVNQVPHELTRAEMDVIRDEFVESARRGAEAGFDLLELHCAHGYLLSAFLSPFTNRRLDDYGGSVVNRLRYPLEVFAAMREVWPASLPMTVRISATDWVDGGQTLDDAIVDRRGVREGRCRRDRRLDRPGDLHRAAGVRAVYQTPYADTIRNRVEHPHDHRRRHLVLRRRQLDPDGRPRRPVRARPGPPLRPVVDPARRRRAGLRRPGRGLADALARGPAQAAGRPHRRPQAAAPADPRGRDRHPAPPLDPHPAVGACQRRFERAHSPKPGCSPWLNRDTDDMSLDAIEQCYDAIPRSAATTEEVGPFTLFARDRRHGLAVLRPSPARAGRRHHR